MAVVKKIKLSRKQKRNMRRKLAKKLKSACNRHRDRPGVEIDMDTLSDTEFQRMFRLDRETFGELLQKITPFLPADEKKACNSSGSLITAKLRLACTLRWLAGGSYLDICFGFKVSKAAFFSETNRGIIWPVIDAIDSVLEIYLPEEESELDRMAEEFSHLAGPLGRDIFQHCIMAIDGWVCQTRAPTSKEVNRPKDYFNRKGFFGIVCLAGCDARTKFTFFSSKFAGGTHDVIAYRGSELATLLETGKLPSRFYVIGDDAFDISLQLLTPYAGHGLGEWKDSYNYHLSAMRQCIERAFGILTQRWGVFWRPLRCSQDRWSDVAMVCAKLHNLCIDKNIPVAPRHPRNAQTDSLWNVHLNGPSEEEPTRVIAGNDKGATRRRLTHAFEAAGAKRPPHAALNSRK